jgi:hypothetical protein
LLPASTVPAGAVTKAFRDSLANLIDQLQLSGMQFVVCGDMNCLGTSGVTLDASMIAILLNYGLMQHVKAATHIGRNLLDVIVTTDDDAQLVSRVFVELTYHSDHDIVVCRLNAFTRRLSVVRYGLRDVRGNNKAAFYDDIRHLLVFDFSICYSTYQYIKLFQREIACILDRHAPLKVKSLRVGYSNCR